MPQIGDEIKALSITEIEEEIGTDQTEKTGGKYKKYVWVDCPDCGEARWALKRRLGGNTKRLCKTCTIKRAGKFSVTTHKEI